MGQLFSWHVDDGKPEYEFKTGRYKSMEVSNDASSDYLVHVNIDGKQYENVEKGSRRTYTLPAKDDYKVSIIKFAGGKGSANGGCSLL